MRSRRTRGVPSDFFNDYLRQLRAFDPGALSSSLGLPDWSESLEDAQRILFFTVRPVGYLNGSHFLQVALTDELSNTLFSAVARFNGPEVAASRMLPLTLDEAAYRGAPDFKSLERILIDMCAGAYVVVFGRACLAFLPEAALIRLEGVRCVWEKFSSYLVDAMDEPMEINDILVQAGFSALRTNDAVARTHAIREIYYWMLELETEFQEQARMSSQALH
jgi:hypothetical protein